MKIRFFFVLLLALLLVACEQEVEQSTVQLGDVFTVGAGMTAVVQPEDLRITFTEVVGDSRCPTQVECIVAGEANILLTVQQGDGEAAVLEFTTIPAPNQEQPTQTYRDYSIQLQSLDPYPQDPDTPIATEDYRATLRVERQ